jgi:hypothetical protein
MADIQPDYNYYRNIVKKATGLEAKNWVDPEYHPVKSLQELREYCKNSDAGACLSIPFNNPQGHAKFYNFEGTRNSDPSAYEANISHEMTHYVQYLNGLFNSYSCLKEGEPQAYKTSNYVLHLARDGLPDFSQRYINKMSYCSPEEIAQYKNDLMKKETSANPISSTSANPISSPLNVSLSLSDAVKEKKHHWWNLLRL